MLLDSRRGATVYNQLMQIVQEPGVDPTDLGRGLREDEDKMLRRIGLWSE